MPLGTKEMYAMLEENEKVRGLVEALEDRTRLRDQFAAAALTGLLDKSDAGTELAAWWPEMACAAAYRWADAMLAAREAK